MHIGLETHLVVHFREMHIDLFYVHFQDILQVFVVFSNYFSFSNYFNIFLTFLETDYTISRVAGCIHWL